MKPRTTYEAVIRGRLIAGLAAGLCGLAAVAYGANVAPPPATANTSGAVCNPDFATAHHRIMLRGHPLDYVSRAGFLPIRAGETGETHGCMFFVAYERERKHGQSPRPLSFIWNGGPGSNSTCLHLEAYGPRKIAMAVNPTLPQPRPLALEDNQDTLLDQSDLVFIDPIGTGYSRPTKAELGSEFYNVKGDIASVREFIRVYRTHFDELDAPVFLVGESYGVWRAAGVAEALEEHGIRVAGAVLISGGIPVGPVQTWPNKVALVVPNRTAAAFYFHKLSPDLQADFHKTIAQSREWAENVYAPALARADSLSPQEREEIVQKLSHFTGIDASKIDRTTLILPRAQFTQQLLASDKKVLASLDMRVTAPEVPDSQRIDLILHYMREDLQFRNDLPYLGIGDDGYTPLADAGRKSINERWNYNQLEGEPQNAPDPNEGVAAKAITAEATIGPGEHQPWLERAMKLDPAMKVLVAAGWFDSWNSCVGNDYVVSHLDPVIGRNVIAKCYEAGHVIYRDKLPAAELRADIREFYSGILGR